jgi:spore maturation protein CgeB
MNILIYGEGYFFAIAPQLKKSLEQLNCAVEIFNWTSYLYTERGYNLKNRILNRLMMPAIAAKINRDLISSVKNNKYDLVLVNNGWHLTGSTIDTVKKNTKHVVLWSTDELYNDVFYSYIHPESYLKYDCIFSQRKHLFDFYRSKGIKRLEYLPLFYYPEHQPVTIPENDKDMWGSDIAFMGTWSKAREKMLDVLEGLNLKIWGGQWNKCSKDFEGKFEITNKIAWLEDMARVANSTKIIIDALTKEQNDKINMKNLQIPACGGFLITSRTDLLLELFEEDKEIVCYDTYEELKEKCKYYLLHEEERKIIAINAHKKVVNGRNAIIDRAKDILDVVNTLEK